MEWRRSRNRSKKRSWQINSSSERERQEEWESERARKSHTKLDIDSVRGQAYEGARCEGVKSGVKFWNRRATKYGRINMFKIFMCPSAAATIIVAAALCLPTDLTKTVPPPPSPLPLHPPTWLALSCLVGTRFGNEPGSQSGTCVYFYLRQKAKGKRERERERERAWHVCAENLCYKLLIKVNVARARARASQRTGLIEIFIIVQSVMENCGKCLLTKYIHIISASTYA